MMTTILFKLERETKGALRFCEVDTNDTPILMGYKIGTLYIRKGALEGDVPQKLTVTVAVR